MSDTGVSDEELTELIDGMKIAADAFIRGDMQEYLRFVKHADDYTLMAPTGGETRRGFDDSPEVLAAMSAYFQSGEAEFEVIETYRSGNLAVLVAVEHQHGEVGGLPDQDWSLRLTLVFRRVDGQWFQVHRHADALVNEIELSTLATLRAG